MLSMLPPVGQRLRWRRGPLPEWSEYRVEWLASGTAALARSLQMALAHSPGRQDVILPAYGCPDLVAATLYAGGCPRLVDCAPGQPGFDLQTLREACGIKTAAVVAVSFLGIREPLADIAAIAAEAGAVLIEDCAQWYPEQPPPVPLAAQVISFGRGKPVNLLGGGALLLPRRGPLPDPPLPVSELAPLSRQKATLFNAVLWPPAYGLISRLPGLGVGETRYHPLRSIERMDPVRQSLAAANIKSYCERSDWRERELDELFGGLPAFIALPLVLAKRRHRLLRYPVLCRDAGLRDRLLKALKPLGASAFYNSGLAAVEGVAELLNDPPALPEAAAFAQRLLTLPLHDGVKPHHIERMRILVRQLAG